MVKCRICGFNFDNGELRNGMCEDCIDEDLEKEKRQEKLARLINAKSEQMEIKFD